MSCCKPESKKRFRPNFREKPLTEKFYARHDYLVPHASYKSTVELYEQIIDKRQKLTLRDERLAPLTENQMYGWLWHLADDYSTGYDPVLFKHHLHANVDIKMQIRIMSDLLKIRKRV